MVSYKDIRQTWIRKLMQCRRAFAEMTGRCVMKRKWLAGILVLWAITVFSLTASADEIQYTQKETEVIRDQEEAGELPLRFYEETPHVPYMGFCEYSKFMRRQTLALREEDGLVILENGNGDELVCDIEAGKITIRDWNQFFALPLPLEHEALGWKDTSTSFIRIAAVDFEGEPAPVELDLGRYGIRIYADEEDIYLPVSVLSNLMTDIATNHLLYNGEKLFARRMDLEGSSPAGFWESEAFQKLFEGEDRPEDIIQQCYADLCFTFDHFFGHPGVAALDEALAQKGLDQALTDLGRKGTSIKEGLLSPSLAEYISAMNELFMACLSDGHTVFTSWMALMQVAGFEKNQSFRDKLGNVLKILESPKTMQQILNLIIPVQRSAAWGDETYREYGSTAIIRLDTFMPDEKAWNSYYNGEGDFPQDCLGTVISGLRKAAENPDIENIIFDLTCNNGGSPDVMMAVLAVTTGQNQLYGIHKLTGQKLVFTFEADTNFDGVYDEADKEVHYDYNYGVLTSRYAFSCGNLFPIIAQEAGAVIIGEPTSGGSCCVQVGSDAHGFIYMLSSAQWQLTDAQGEGVEGGCSVDLPIDTKSPGLLDKLASTVGIDTVKPVYSDFYDEERLDGMMNEWFGSQMEMAPAA